MKNITIGFVLITFVTVLLWVIGKDMTLALSQPLRSGSQITALLGLVYMGYSLIWSSRIKMIEKKVGGMDKMMKAHHGVGMIAFLLLMHHPLLLIIQSLPMIEVAKTYFIPGTDLSYNLGIYSFYILIFSLISIVFVKLPYNIFRATHQFMGLSFLLGGVHAMTAGSDLSSNIYLRNWVMFWIIAGTASAIYIIFLYRLFGPKHHFFVSSLQRVGDVMHITLRSIGKDFNYEPGQFCFVSFKHSDMSPESHPFTISSSVYHDKEIRISAKILGDYTLTLTSLKVDTPAVVYGPYGNFGQEIVRASEQIWIAGGIGVTPFVGMIEKVKNSHNKKVALIYVAREGDQDLFLEEIPRSVHETDNILFVPWFTNKQSRPTAQKILDCTGRSKDSSVFICGPTPMMDGLKRQFMSLGISSNHIFTESFSMT